MHAWRTLTNEGEFVAREKRNEVLLYIGLNRIPGSPFSVSGRRISLSHPDIARISIGPATTLRTALNGPARLCESLASSFESVAK